MNTQLDCIPCFFRQTLEAARMATADERMQHEVLRRVAALVAEFPESSAPIEMGREIHRIIRHLTRCSDPYLREKQESNARALALYPQLLEQVLSSPDPLLAALRLAAAGNVIDFGANPHFDLERSIQESHAAHFSPTDYALLRAHLAHMGSLLYIGDNAGEIVFDRLLLEQLVARGIRVTFVVRPGPILNDATVDDARTAGVTTLAEVISNGDLSPGLILRHCDAAFRERFRGAAVVLAKGQGNYEGLAEERGPIFFLLKAKCAVIARRLGVSVGDLVLRAGIAARLPPVR